MLLSDDIVRPEASIMMKYVHLRSMSEGKIEPCQRLDFFQVRICVGFTIPLFSSDKRLMNLRSIVRHVGMWQLDQTKAKQRNRERAYCIVMVAAVMPLLHLSLRGSGAPRLQRSEAPAPSLAAQPA